jgi:hypothetical protein
VPIGIKRTSFDHSFAALAHFAAAYAQIRLS